MEKETEAGSSGAVTIQGTKSKGRRREQSSVESHHPAKVNSEETKPRNKPPHLISLPPDPLSFCLIQTKARLHGDLLIWSTQARLLEDSTGGEVGRGCGRKAIWPSLWPLLLSIHARLPSCLVIKPEEQSSLYSRLKLFQVSFLLWDPLKTVALRELMHIRNNYYVLVSPLVISSVFLQKCDHPYSRNKNQTSNISLTYTTAVCFFMISFLKALTLPF